MNLPPLLQHLELSTLADTPTCPRCRRKTGISAESLRGTCECQNPACGQHWYAIYLKRGPVEAQLVPIFSGELAREIMDRWRLPKELGVPKFWQLALTRQQMQDHGRAGSRTLVGAVLLAVRQRLAALAAPDAKR